MFEIAESKSITALDTEREILLPPEQMYKNKMEASMACATLSLDDAFTSILPANLSGMLQDNALPSTPRQEINTGLLPPVDESMLIFEEVQNSEAKGLQKYRKLLDMGSLTLADTKGYRIRTAYRLIRQMARIRGLLEGWTWIQSALDFAVTPEGVSAWSVPMRLKQSMYLTGFRGIRNVLNRMDGAREIYTVNTPQGMRGYKGITTLPPPLPDSAYPVKAPAELWAWRLSGAAPDTYVPQNDKQLCLYCEAMALLSHQMSIDEGSPEEPWAGIYGKAGLFNPGTARLAWPTRDELVLYEEELLLHTFDMISTKSEIGTRKYLMQFFGFSRAEAVDIVKTAIAAGGMLYNETAEDQRSVILKRISSIADKASDSCDPRAELSAIKLQAQLLGLTTSDENDSLSTLRDAALAALRQPEDPDDI